MGAEAVQSEHSGVCAGPMNTLDEWMKTAPPHWVKHLEIICVDRNGKEYGRYSTREFVDTDEKMDVERIFKTYDFR